MANYHEVGFWFFYANMFVGLEAESWLCSTQLATQFYGLTYKKCCHVRIHVNKVGKQCTFLSCYMEELRWHLFCCHSKVLFFMVLHTRIDIRNFNLQRIMCYDDFIHLRDKIVKVFDKEILVYNLRLFLAKVSSPNLHTLPASFGVHFVVVVVRINNHFWVEKGSKLSLN